VTNFRFLCDCRDRGKLQGDYAYNVFNRHNRHIKLHVNDNYAVISRFARSIISINNLFVRTVRYVCILYIHENRIDEQLSMLESCYIDDKKIRDPISVARFERDCNHRCFTEFGFSAKSRGIHMPWRFYRMIIIMEILRDVVSMFLPFLFSSTRITRRGNAAPMHVPCISYETEAIALYCSQAAVSLVLKILK